MGDLGFSDLSKSIGCNETDSVVAQLVNSTRFLSLIIFGSSRYRDALLSSKHVTLANMVQNILQIFQEPHLSPLCRGADHEYTLVLSFCMSESRGRTDNA